jgi:hypothetical protein
LVSHALQNPTSEPEARNTHTHTHTPIMSGAASNHPPSSPDVGEAANRAGAALNHSPSAPDVGEADILAGAAMNHSPSAPDVGGEQSKLARQMRGLKKRRKFTRRLKKGPEKGSDKKLSSFNFQAFREEHNMQEHVNAQQVHAEIAPAKARSPLSLVKMERHNLRASLQASAKKRQRLEEKSRRDSKRIADLKAHNNQLMQDASLFQQDY